MGTTTSSAATGTGAGRGAGAGSSATTTPGSTNNTKTTPEDVVLVVGKSGIGKSTLCNSLMKGDVFVTGAAGTGVTREPSMQLCKMFNAQLVDTVGVGDVSSDEKKEESLDDKKNLKLLLQVLKKKKSRIIAVIFAMEMPKVNRMPSEIANVLTVFNEVIGEDIFNRFICLFPMNGNLPRNSKRLLKMVEQKKEFANITLGCFIDVPFEVVEEDEDFNVIKGNYDVKKLVETINMIRGFIPYYIPWQHKQCSDCKVYGDPRIITSRCVYHPTITPEHKGPYSKQHPASRRWRHGRGARAKFTKGSAFLAGFTLGIVQNKFWTCCGKHSSESGCKWYYPCCDNFGSPSGCTEKCTKCKRWKSQRGCAGKCVKCTRFEDENAGCIDVAAHQGFK